MPRRLDLDLVHGLDERLMCVSGVYGKISFSDTYLYAEGGAHTMGLVFLAGLLIFAMVEPRAGEVQTVSELPAEKAPA